MLEAVGNSGEGRGEDVKNIRSLAFAQIPESLYSYCYCYWLSGQFSFFHLH
jgi:hypothetical protein